MHLYVLLFVTICVSASVYAQQSQYISGGWLGSDCASQAVIKPKPVYLGSCEYSNSNGNYFRLYETDEGILMGATECPDTACMNYTYLEIYPDTCYVSPSAGYLIYVMTMKVKYGNYSLTRFKNATEDPQNITAPSGVSYECTATNQVDLQTVNFSSGVCQGAADGAGPYTLITYLEDNPIYSVVISDECTDNICEHCSVGSYYLTKSNQCFPVSPSGIGAGYSYLGTPILPSTTSTTTASISSTTGKLSSLAPAIFQKSMKLACFTGFFVAFVLYLS